MPAKDPCTDLAELEQRLLAAGIAERQIFGKMRLLKLGRDCRMLEQRLNLRSE